MKEFELNPRIYSLSIFFIILRNSSLPKVPVPEFIFFIPIAPLRANLKPPLPCSRNRLFFNDRLGNKARCEPRRPLRPAILFESRPSPFG